MEKTRKSACILILVAVLILILSSSVTVQSKISKADCSSVFRKSPYLIFEGDNTKMRVQWQLVEDIPVTIKWGTDTSYSLGNGTIAKSGKDNLNTFKTTGLNPGNRYFYQLTAGKLAKLSLTDLFLPHRPLTQPNSNFLPTGTRALTQMFTTAL